MSLCRHILIDDDDDNDDAGFISYSYIAQRNALSIQACKSYEFIII